MMTLDVYPPGFGTSKSSFKLFEAPEIEKHLVLRSGLFQL